LQHPLQPIAAAFSCPGHPAIFTLHHQNENWKTHIKMVVPGAAGTDCCHHFVCYLAQPAKCKRHRKRIAQNENQSLTIKCFS